MPHYMYPHTKTNALVSDLPLPVVIFIVSHCYRRLTNFFRIGYSYQTNEQKFYMEVSTQNACNYRLVDLPMGAAEYTCSPIAFLFAY